MRRNDGGAAVVDDGAFGGNSFDDILRGKYRRHVAIPRRFLPRFASVGLSVFRSHRHLARRNLMLKRYGEKALEEVAAQPKVTLEFSGVAMFHLPGEGLHKVEIPMAEKNPELPTIAAEDASGAVENGQSDADPAAVQEPTEEVVGEAASQRWDDFEAFATQIFKHGAQGIVLTFQEVDRIKATNDEVITLLAQAMPSEGHDQDARQFFQKQIRLLDELYGRIRVLPDRVITVYQKFKDVNESIAEIQPKLNRELELIDRSLRPPVFTALVLRLATETLKNEPVFLTSLPGIAALPLTQAVENYETVLTTFLGRPAGSFGLKERAKAAFDLIRADAVKTGVHFFVPRLMLILDLANALTTPAFESDVKDLAEAAPIMSKLLKLERTGLNLLSSFALIEDLIAHCILAVEASAEIMKLHFSMALGVLENIPRKPEDRHDGEPAPAK